MSDPLEKDIVLNESEDTSPAVKIKNSPEIERNALPQPVQNFVRSTNGIKEWETDPQMLYDYSNNLIVNTMIDTVAKDIATTNFTVDNDDALNLLENPHPEKTFEDIVEEIVNDLLRTGNAFLVLNRYENGDPAELVVPPAPTMFKIINQKGITESYAQIVNGRNQRNQINPEDVYHIKWSNSNNRYYGLGPTEMSLDTIDIIDELTLIEILDLTEGGISKIVSQTESHDTNPMDSQEWQALKNEFNSSKGERHKSMLAKGSFSATTVTTDYNKLNILDRYKYHIQTLGAAFKVNPSYVGFDFENTNRATDESQREAYKERGVKTTLELIGQKLTQLTRNEFNTDFEWKTSTSQDPDELEYYETLANTVQALSEAGIEFDIENETVTIPDDATVEQIQNTVETSTILSALNNTTDALANYTDEQDEEEKDFESCVSSVLQDNPDLTEEEAEAICGAKKIELTDKKEEFANNIEYGENDFGSTLVHLEKNTDSRREAINHCKDKLNGFSPNTYYKWLDLIGLK